MNATESEMRLARYKQVEKEGDKLGRVIGVRRLKPSEQTKVAAYTADVTGSDKIMTPEGIEVVVPHRLPLMIAAAVCMIDENMIPFAKTRGELDSIYDKLDQEGIEAASKAISRLVENDFVGDVKVEAKN